MDFEKTVSECQAKDTPESKLKPLEVKQDEKRAAMFQRYRERRQRKLEENKRHDVEEKRFWSDQANRLKQYLAEQD